MDDEQCAVEWVRISSIFSYFVETVESLDEMRTFKRQHERDRVHFY